MLKVTAIGNVGRMKKVEGRDILNFSVAVNDRYTDKSGNKVETTEWLNCTVFNKAAKIVEQYVKVGDKLFVEGKPRTRKYTDANGTEKYSTEYIIDNFEFLSPKS